MKGESRKPEGAKREAREVIKGRVLRPSPDEVQPLYPASRLLRGEIAEAERILEDADRALEAAQAQAAETRQAAEEEARQILKEARQSQAEIQAQAAEAGRRQALGDVQQLLSNVTLEAERARQAFPLEVGRTAFLFAKAVLDVEFEVQPKRVVDLVATALKRARLHQDIRVHLNPADLPFVEEARGTLAAGLDSTTRLELLADTDVARCGVVIETEMGSYLASVEEQLSPLREHLRLPPERGEKEPGRGSDEGTR